MAKRKIRVGIELGHPAHIQSRYKTMKKHLRNRPYKFHFSGKVNMRMV